MEARIECARCHIPKPTRNFRKRKYTRIASLRKAPEWAGKTEGRSSYCRACQSLFCIEYYNKQKDEQYRWLFTYFKEHPCACGEADPLVLDFDHDDGVDKKKNIGSMIGHCSLRTLQKEIAKCTVRCANCHRRRTAKQFNWRWLTIIKEMVESNQTCTSNS